MQPDRNTYVAFWRQV